MVTAIPTYTLKAWRCGNCLYWRENKCAVASSDHNAKGEKRAETDFGCVRFAERKEKAE